MSIYTLIISFLQIWVALTLTGVDPVSAGQTSFSQQVGRSGLGEDFNP